MTPQQKRALDFIRYQIETTGVAPSFEDLAWHLGLKSKSGVHRIVHRLAEAGHLILEPHRARAMRLPAAMSVSEHPNWSRLRALLWSKQPSLQSVRAMFDELDRARA